MPLLSSWLKSRRIGTAASYLQGRTLDFGCGDGTLSQLVQDYYVGVDLNPDNLARARQTFDSEFLLPDELRPDMRFDTIALIAVIEHLDDPLSHLQGLRAKLNPGGRIVVTTPNPCWEWLHAAGSQVGLVARSAHHAHVSLLDRRGLRHLGEAIGLEMAVYKRFLGGLNQLAVFE